jgi:hypothetical protein
VHESSWFQVLTSAIMKMTASWDMTQCSLI